MKHPNPVCLLLFAVLSAMPRPAQAGAADHTLDVYWIDSEGGGSTLIVTPEDESILIDSGYPGLRDPGRIVTAAKAAGITRIDHFILTHFHSDHFGGAAILADLMPIDALYDKGMPNADPDGRVVSVFPMMIKPYKAMTVGHRSVYHAGYVFPLRPPAQAGALPLEIRCLAVNQTFVDPRPGQEKNPLAGTIDTKPSVPIANDDNANSGAFMISFGPFRFFDGGDLSWYMEEKLVTPYNLPGGVDVFQVDHHGFAVSNNPILVRSLAPTVSVMNNGPRKGDDPPTFATLKSAPSIKAMYQLHKNLLVASEGNTSDELIANVPEKCDGNYIKMTVAPDGMSYTIAIPATGVSHTYQTVAR